MKYGYAKVLSLVVLLAASTMAQTLSQSTSSVVVSAGNSAACGVAGGTVDNGYFRSYSLAAVGGPIDIVSVTFGVELASHPNFPLVVRLYTDNATPAAPAPYAGLTLMHTENVSLTAGPLSIATVAMTGTLTTFVPTDQLVVEVFSATGNGQFYIGSNALGETAPGYLRAPACAIAEPSTTAVIGFPTMHIILNVNYVPTGTTSVYPGTNEDLTLLTAVNANPLTGGIGNDIKTAIAGDLLTIKIVSNGGTFNNRELLLLAHPFPTGFPPFPAAPNIHVGFPGLIILIGADPWPFGPALLPPGGTTVALQIPPGLTGASAILQGAVIAIGACNNGIYASTDAHEIQIL